jgi:hypothetical protein
MFIKTTFLIIALTSANAVSLRTAARCYIDPAPPTVLNPPPVIPPPVIETPEIPVPVLIKIPEVKFKTEEAKFEIAKKCFERITLAVPPSFCWKKNPNGVKGVCPANYD